jgi:ABC-type transporter Mla MlaB component
MNKYIVAQLLMFTLLSPTVVADVDHQKRVDLIQEVQKAIIIAGINSDDGAFTINEPSRGFYHFGAVLDQQLQVIAVTPASDAAKAGVKSADIIKKINNQEVNTDSLSVILATINDMQDGAKLTIQVQRENKLLMLQGTVTRQKIPAWRLQIMPQQDVAENMSTPAGCGYVSVFNTPAISLTRHRVNINEIKAVDFSSGLFYEPVNEVLKVPSGSIEITVQEQIRSEIISRYRSDLLVRNQKAVKVVTLTVEPNKVYHLAAEYFPNPSERENKDDYWQPIVWKTTERSCE